MAFAKVQHELANPWMLAVYVIAMIAVCWHFAYGIWLFAAKWGITPGETARKRFGYACARSRRSACGHGPGQHLGLRLAEIRKHAGQRSARIRATSPIPRSTTLRRITTRSPMPTAEATHARIDWKAFQEIAPEFATGMAAITHALKKSTIEPELRELIKIRASQFNGCAFCVQFHLNDARKINVPAAKLDLLAAWREAGIYSARECAALDWTERVTLLAQHHIDDRDICRAQGAFLRARDRHSDHRHRPDQHLEPDRGAASLHASIPNWFLAFV